MNKTIKMASIAAYALALVACGNKTQEGTKNKPAEADTLQQVASKVYTPADTIAFEGLKILISKVDVKKIELAKDATSNGEAHNNINVHVKAMNHTTNTISLPYLSPIQQGISMPYVMASRFFMEKGAKSLLQNLDIPAKSSIEGHYVLTTQGTPTLYQFTYNDESLKNSTDPELKVLVNANQFATPLSKAYKGASAQVEIGSLLNISKDPKID
ncbi:MAG: hypothetical protein RL662_1022 [Bacteroidota bacterium]|jgi:hypothetical protein